MAEGDVFKKDESAFLGGIGSVNTTDLGKPVAKKSNIFDASGSATTESTGQAKALFSPLTLAPQLVNIDEVTLTSKYYPATQPFLVQFHIQFPQSVDANGIPNYSLDSMPIKDILEVRPNNLISFSANEKLYGLGTFTLTLFDPKWNEVETRIIKSKGRIRIRWGYADQGSMLGAINNINTTATPWIDAMIFNYSIKFGLEGTTIHMTGSLVGYELTFTKKYEAFGEKGQTISDIVEEIAEKSGFTPVVEPTKPVEVKDSFDETNLVNKLFIRKGQTTLDFLGDLVEYARSKITDAGAYMFYIKRPMKVGDLPELHFHTAYYKGLSNEANDLSKISVPTFTLHKTANTPVIDYSPLWQGTIANLSGASDNFSVIIDGTSKDINPYTPSIKTVAQPYDNKSGTIYMQAKEDATCTVNVLNTQQVSDLNHDEQMSILHNKLSNAAIHIMRAKLTIQGTTAFQLVDKIAVTVYIPQATAKLHWTSGYFRIKSIVHSIEAGSYKTTFELFTDGRSLKDLDFMPVANNSNG